MEPASLTIEILKQIRDGISQTNARLDQTNAELHETNSELQRFRVETGQRFDRVDERLDRHGRAIVKLVGEVHAMGERFDNFLHGAHHDAHEELRERVSRLEAKVG
jgi:septal ring factor EnvC (AmiA/AmiB activator)